MSTGCFRKKKVPSMKQFIFLLKKCISGRFKRSHFVINVEFDKKKANSKTLMYNEVHYLVLEKRKILDLAEKSTFQLL